ncbi:phosphatidylserine synthase 2-like [Saccoglossus kowalevskii]|uniref:Phosphatidylserine synthase n=1 Tax=Saccoglossus kowalevskii TaxID=10224 RepID=A0ABM0GRR1_SACKO|nr:PREDICTED: phosphatidylserine synthase 2-like [Saccoglossus kowalevskii]
MSSLAQEIKKNGERVAPTDMEDSTNNVQNSARESELPQKFYRDVAFVCSQCGCVGHTVTAKSTPFAEKQSHVYDDGTTSYFWRAHTLTVLFCMLAVFVYVALIEEVSDDLAYNTKRGVSATVMVFCLFGMTQAKDGPFNRPHPAVWRLILMLSVIYELILVFVLFQTVDDARQLLKYLDKDLGKPLPETSYGENCVFYDPDHPDPFHNFWKKWDFFLVAHVFGWWFTSLMIRDFWVSHVVSILFELMEYTLEHQLPNFSECWWDHWIMDAAICNSIGIYAGWKTLEYLNIKQYHWINLWKIPTYRGKVKRIAAQFTPYSWTRYDWKPTASFKRWLAVLAVISVILLGKLNYFYLKFVLWLAPPHYLNLIRVFLVVPESACALRETYQYLEDPTCKKFGQQSWITLATLGTEVLIILKFDPQLVLKPLPSHIAWCWLIGISALTVWTIWHFFIRQYIIHYYSVRSRSESMNDHGDISESIHPLYNDTTATENDHKKHQ